MALQSIAEEATSGFADQQLARERNTRDHCVKDIVVVAASMVRHKLGSTVDSAAEAALQTASRQMFAMAQMPTLPTKILLRSSRASATRSSGPVHVCNSLWRQST